MDSAGIPNALLYAINSISGVSTNSFKVVSSSAGDEVSSGGRFSFMLPSVGLFDTKTSKITFSVKTTGAGTRLPKYATSLIDQIVVRMGGITVSQSQSGLYGVWNTIQEETGQTHQNEISGHRECLATMKSDGLILTAAGNESYHEGIGATSALFEIDLGEFAQCHPRILDLSLLPQVSIEVVLAGTAVLSAPKDSTKLRGQSNAVCAVNTVTSLGWSMLRPTLQANMYSLMSGAYENSLRARMEQTGFLQVCMPNTVSFSQAFTGSARFSISAMSLNKLTTVFRRKAFATAQGFIPLAGYAGLALTEATMNQVGGGANATTKQGIARYQGAFQQFSLPTKTPAHDEDKGKSTSGNDAMDYGNDDILTPVTLQYAIQSALVPQYPCDQAEMMNLTCWANNIDSLPDCKSHAEYFYNKCIFAFPLNLPAEAHDRCSISGLSTVGSNAFIEVKGAGGNLDTTNYDCITFATTTSILRIGSGKAVELIS